MFADFPVVFSDCGKLRIDAEIKAKRELISHIEYLIICQRTIPLPGNKKQVLKKINELWIKTDKKAFFSVIEVNIV